MVQCNFLFGTLGMYSVEMLGKRKGRKDSKSGYSMRHNLFLALGRPFLPRDPSSHLVVRGLAHVDGVGYGDTTPTGAAVVVSVAAVSVALVTRAAG